jgi:outer membrane lipoprotein-sorting protein
MRLDHTVLTAILLYSATVLAGSDSFDNIKRTLAEAGCVHFEFLNIIESDIFDSVDSTDGEAWLAADGQYLIRLDSDEYLFDGSDLYSYSAENNQVTVEQLDVADAQTGQISFIRRLDEWFKTDIIEPDLRFRLSLREGIEGDLPDTMVIEIDKKNNRIRSIEYLDLNEENNRIIINGQDISDSCPEQLFIPDYPDSVELIRL